MKVPTILAVVAAVALTCTVHAAPSASPSSASARNGTLPDGGAELLSRVVKYNHKGAAEFTAQYNEALYGNSTLHAIEKRAVSSDVQPFCVGVASNPPRVQVFRNKMKCDDNGWGNLYIFTAHTKEDEFIAPTAACSGFGSAPSRSMISRGKNCKDGNNWIHDFTFYESNAHYYFTTVWYAEGPHRMLLYPGYNGLAHGWKKSHDIKYRSFYRLASDPEVRSLKVDGPGHTAVHKKIKMSKPNDVTTMRCAEMLIGAVPSVRLPYNSVSTYAGKELSNFLGLAFDANCTKLISSSSVVVRRVFVNGFGSVEVNIGKSTIAAASIKLNHYVVDLVLNQALFESLRTGKPVMIGQNDEDERNGVVVFVKDSFIAIGAKWDAPI